MAVKGLNNQQKDIRRGGEQQCVVAQQLQTQLRGALHGGLVLRHGRALQRVQLQQAVLELQEEALADPLHQQRGVVQRQSLVLAELALGVEEEVHRLLHQHPHLHDAVLFGGVRAHVENAGGSDVAGHRGEGGHIEGGDGSIYWMSPVLGERVLLKVNTLEMEGMGRMRDTFFLLATVDNVFATE